MGEKKRRKTHVGAVTSVPVFTESQTWAASPEILGEGEKEDKEMTDTVRARMRQAETHRQKN